MRELKKGILDQVYNHAGKIVSSMDSQSHISKGYDKRYVERPRTEHTNISEPIASYEEDSTQRDKNSIQTTQIAYSNISEPITKYDNTEATPTVQTDYGNISEPTTREYNNRNVIKFVRNEPAQNIDADYSENATETSEPNKYTGDKGDNTRVVYEQAIYYMFDNKYDDAAKLFRKIIESQPNNKAARIRLQECIDRQPQLSAVQDVADDAQIEEMIRSDGEPITGSTFDASNTASEEYSRQESINQENSTASLDASVTEFKEAMRSNVQNLAEAKDLPSISENTPTLPKFKHKKSEEELHKMYEEAIYTMFQNNYEDAAKIFTEILRIRPDNKAARIRLQECKEAINNA